MTFRAYFGTRLPRPFASLLALSQAGGAIRTFIARPLALQTLPLLPLLPLTALQCGTLTVGSGTLPIPQFLRAPARFGVAAFSRLILALGDATGRKEET